MQERIYDIIVSASRPLNRMQLMDKVYCNGGYYSKERPENPNVLSVQILNMNRKVLRPHGIEIKSRQGRGATYWIQRYDP